VSKSIEEFLEKYITHDPRMYSVVYDPKSQTLSFKLENVEWVQKKYEKENRFFTELDIVFHDVINLNSNKNLADIDESILGIYLDGKNTVSIVLDEENYPVIKFSAKSVEVKEIE